MKKLSKGNVAILTRPVFEEPDTKTLTKAPDSTSSEEMSADPSKEATSGDRRETEESSDGTVTSQTVPEGETIQPNTDKQSPADGEETPDSSALQVWPLKLNFFQHPCLSGELFSLDLKYAIKKYGKSKRNIAFSLAPCFFSRFWDSC